MTGASVLIVDDDPALLQALPEALRLRMEGVVADTCDSAASAVQRIADADYDAIVTDIKMPGMDGLALLATIRSLRPDTPTLLITGHGERDLAVQALRGGAYDFIQKPIDRDYFIAALRRAIHARRLRREVAQQRAILERHARELEQVVEERTRELRQANQLKDEFLAVLSHELRTPLSPILTWSHLLRDRSLDEETRQRAVEAIERSARAQAQLIGDLLDVSRIITGKLRLDVEPVPLRRVVEAAVEVVRPAADAKKIEVCCGLDSTAGSVAGDAGRLQQVMWNLLSNAVKFTPSGGCVEVILRAVASHVEIAVRDSGQGIKPEFLPHIFERFEQQDKSMTRVHGGLGIGLAIVRHIVEAHGGTVHAESPGEGKGAVFTVKLPTATAPRMASEASERPAAQAADPTNGGRAPVLGGLRVLVVDNEPDSNEVVSTLLSSYGADVRVAGSTSQALDVLGTWGADVLVTDIGMPHEDGYALLAEMRAQEDTLGKIPAVALTAYASREDRVRLLSAGFQAHVPKPLEPTDFITTIANVARTAGKL